MIESIHPILAVAGPAAQGVWDQLCAHQLPSQKQVVDAIAELRLYESAILLAVGLVYLLQGWRIFKVLVVVNAAAMGFLAGGQLGAMQSDQWALYGSLIGAAALAILALPLMKFAIALMGCLAGGFLGYNAWRYFATLYSPNMTQYSWVGAIVGLLLLGVLAFVIFKLAVIVFTSLQGSLLIVAGVLGLTLKLLAHQQDLHDRLYTMLTTSPHLLPILVLGPAVIGAAGQALAHHRHGSSAKKEG